MPIAVPPLMVLAALGAVVIGRWAVREYRRINTELDARKMAREPVDRWRLPTLRRDPVSGEYRPR
ncbi:MAG: hypothetical protein GEU91_17355 [Rhizobiales bacterium]|nr:hypothetical protein [Hyphomicrobiales bacterium]